jgi:GTP-binding protein
MDALYGEDEEEVIKRLKDTFEPEGFKVFPISAVSGKGVKELLYHVKGVLDKMDRTPVVFEREFFAENIRISEEPFEVWKEEESLYVVEGPRIERMLGYTNLESEKGFLFFQNFMRDNGILEQLEGLGIQEGDTVRMYGLQFDYYK